MDAAELDAYLLLSMTPGLGPILTARLLSSLSSASAVLTASIGQLSNIQGIGRQKAESLRREMDNLITGPALEQEKALIAQHGVTLLTPPDAEYPALLKHIADPPSLLYMRGQFNRSDALGLAIVGARRCSAYGREQADRLAALAVQAGLCVVSGGAYGIDAAAHRAALRLQGRTIAVLGSGLAQPYPADHADLFAQIADGYGALVSELPMSTPPVPENFPRRNRIISGLSLGVLVIEAAVQSGALITARLAAEEHGREVMALPGRVDAATSAGCHKMIREGWATLVTNIADVLDALGETGALLKAGLTTEKPGQNNATQPPALFTHNLTPSQKQLTDALDQPRSLDQLAAATGLTVATIQADLTLLQIRGLIGRENGMFIRKH